MKSTVEICAASGIPERSYPAGETVIEEGHHSSSLYILKQGSVEVCKQEVELATISNPGAWFGEISVLIGGQAMATVKTLSDSVFYVIEDGKTLLQEHPELNYHIAVLLATRLKSVTSYLVDIQQQFASNDDHLNMVDEVLESLIHHQKPTDA
ncbi:MAG: cyclic nucleotide-binding domain-containing protein [Verrucomicrobiota bacterium]